MSGRIVRMRVEALPAFMDCARLLGPRVFALTPASDGTLTAEAELPVADAADVQARLRGLGFGGQALRVTVSPPPPRTVVRAARTEDAKRRRASSKGFSDRRARLDPEGRFSLTPEALALEMASNASGLRVIDACCGAGGNAIAFARAGCQVTAIEVSSPRLADARHNAQLYGVANRIRFLCGDAAQLLPELPADLVFIDPPWGESYSREAVHLEDLPVLQSLLPLCGGADATWLKLPPSFDTRELPDFAPTPMFGVGEGDKRRVKFLWLTRLQGPNASHLSQDR